MNGYHEDVGVCISESIHECNLGMVSCMQRSKLMNVCMKPYVSMNVGKDASINEKLDKYIGA